VSGSIGGRIVTSRLQSVLLHAGHVVQQFRQGLFHDQLSQAVGGTCPFALVLFDICILAVYCFRYKRDRKNSITAQSKFAERFRYNLAAACFRYLVPIGLATAFYVLLSCYVYWFPSRRLAHQNAAHSREHFEILRRLRTAVSIGHDDTVLRDQILEDLDRFSPAQCLTWSAIELCRYSIEFFLGVQGQVSAFREILLEEPVGVLVGAALPR